MSGGRGMELALERLPDRPRAAPRALEARVESVAPSGAGHVRLAVVTPEPIAVQAGQFFMLGDRVGSLPGEQRALPRPMAAYDADPARARLAFMVKVIGRGTEQIAALTPGDRLRLIGPLGHGFDLTGTGPVLMLGRGIGAFSLGLVPAQARALGRPVFAVFSAADAAGLHDAEHFSQPGCTVVTVTDQAGDSDVETLRGRLTDRFASAPRPTLVLSCGSRRLRRLALTLATEWSATAQTSIEANMACGLGYCHGCATALPLAGDGEALVCTDGPAFGVVGHAVGGRLRADTIERARS